MLYTIFGFGEKTKYSAVLLETGLYKIKHLIARSQIIYMSTAVWDLKGSVLNQVILEEFNELGEKSSLALVDKIAQSYGFEKISKIRIDKKVLKRYIRSANDQELWFDCYQSSVIPIRPYFRVRNKSHFKWEKLKSKALLAYRCGALKFKTQWRLYNLKRGRGINCVNIICGENDSLSHAKSCSFYFTKWKKEYEDSEEEIASYLLKLNSERIKRYRLPII